jgi:hypothetical protein
MLMIQIQLGVLHTLTYAHDTDTARCTSYVDLCS